MQMIHASFIHWTEMNVIISQEIIIQIIVIQIKN